MPMVWYGFGAAATPYGTGAGAAYVSAGSCSTDTVMGVIG